MLFLEEIRKLILNKWLRRALPKKLLLSRKSAQSLIHPEKELLAPGQVQALAQGAKAQQADTRSISR